MENTNDIQIDPKLQQLIDNKTSGYEYRKRRQDQWREIYSLYRNRVQVNRFTQRQSINMPLMKKTVRTLLKDVDDMPLLFFKSNDNDEQTEKFLNAYWERFLDTQKLVIKDIMDKRQDMLFGRTFDFMNIEDGEITIKIVDPEDILVDRYCDPSNLNTAAFLVHLHIYKPISEIKNNKKYNTQAIADLVEWYKNEKGLIKSQENQDMAARKQEKMQDMGLDDAHNPILQEAYVELSIHINKKNIDGIRQYYYTVQAEDRYILYEDTLENVIGKTDDHYWRTHLPYGTWADDVEVQDFWSDSVGDIIVPINKTLNIYISQQAESRVLRGFGMNYYNSNMVDQFEPSTVVPGPWKWVPLPIKDNANIRDVLQKVEFPDVGDGINEMQYIENIANEATGATQTQQGTKIERQVTLGEVQLALGEAKERIKGMTKFYTDAWKYRGERFVKLIEAAGSKLNEVDLYKEGRNNDAMFKKTVDPNNWKTKSGWTCKIWSQEDKDTNDDNKLQKLNYLMTAMPNNPKVREIYNRSVLEFSDVSPDEIAQIMEIEQNVSKQIAEQQGAGMPMQPGQPMQPMPMQNAPQQPAMQ